MIKKILLVAAICFSTALLSSCDSDDDNHSTENKCSGDCAYCPDRSSEGLYCTGYKNQNCWYCYTGQSCDPQTEVCR